MRDYMDRRVTPPKQVTSPTWGPPPPCKQALRKTEWQAYSSQDGLTKFQHDRDHTDIEKDKHRYINGPDLRGKLFVFSVVARVISLGSINSI